MERSERHATTTSVATRASTAEPVRSLSGISTALTWLLVVSSLACLATLGAFVNRIHVANRAEAARNLGAFVRAALAGEDADGAVNLAAGIMVLLGVAVFVVLIVFLYRATRNTQAWDATPQRWTPGWAIGGWFIPFANLVIPGLVVSETWRRSPEVGSDDAEPSTAPVWIWWVCFVGGVLVLRAYRNSETLDTLRTSDALGAIGCAALTLADLLLVVVVRRLAARQARWAG